MSVCGGSPTGTAGLHWRMSSLNNKNEDIIVISRPVNSVSHIFNPPRCVCVWACVRWLLTDFEAAHNYLKYLITSNLSDRVTSGEEHTCNVDESSWWASSISHMHRTIYRRIPGTVSSLALISVSCTNIRLSIFFSFAAKGGHWICPDEVAIILLKSQIPCAEW